MKTNGKSIVFDFKRPKKFGIERGKKVSCVHLYFFTIFLFKLSLMDWMKSVKDKTPSNPRESKDDLFKVNKN